MAPEFDDPIGRAVHNYHFNSIDRPVIVHSDDFDDDTIDTGYLFRGFEQMPLIEKKAMSLCRGTVLDVGACAGAHSLYLQNKGFDVTAIEKSELCCAVLENRGIINVVNQDVFDYEGKKFDTILLLMNGIGIAGSLERLDCLLGHLKNLLNPKGQILLDSSDLIYLYEQEDGSALIDISAGSYYGQLTYRLSYENIIGEPFQWLYADLGNLENAVENNKMKINNVIEGQHYDYLAQIIAL